MRFERDCFTREQGTAAVPDLERSAAEEDEKGDDNRHCLGRSARRIVALVMLSDHAGHGRL